MHTAFACTQHHELATVTAGCPSAVDRSSSAHHCSERLALASGREREAADFRARLHEELLAHKASLEEQAAAAAAEQHKEQATVCV